MRKIPIYKSGIHQGEEKIVAGNDRSGMVVFSGCHLSCHFCYTPETSRRWEGERIDCSQFEAELNALIDDGAKNLNLISPTHVWPQIVGSLIKLKKSSSYALPLVLKPSGYELPQVASQMGAVADVLVPDFKVVSVESARKTGLPHDYGRVALAAIREMEMRKPRQMSHKASGGVMTQGVLVRHLLMPDFPTESLDVVRSLGSIGFNGVLNLMTRYFDPKQKRLKLASDATILELLEVAEREQIECLVNGRPASSSLSQQEKCA